MAKDRYLANMRRDQGREARAAERDEAVMVTGASLQAQHELDLRMLRELLAHPNLECNEQLKIEDSIAWLNGDPFRTLSAMWRDHYRRTAKSLMLRRLGIDRSTPERINANSAARKRRTGNRKAATSEKRAKLPAWLLGDKSQLPIKPPGRE